MIEAVQKHHLTTPGEGGHYSEIRHVAGRKQQRSLSTGVVGELLFQAFVLDTVPRNEVRCTAASAEAHCAFAHGRRNCRVMRKSEVVVAAEVDQSPAVDRGHQPLAGLG